MEISDTHARWCVLGRHRGHWQIQQFQSWRLKPGWVESGRILDYQGLLDAMQQWFAAEPVKRLAMALPAAVCASAQVDPPRRLMPWQRRRWLADCAADLLGRPAGELSWSAHRLPGSTPQWRLMAVPVELVQDWLGLAEAIGCELVALDEAHQAAWLALDQWQEERPAAGARLFQIGGGSVQALCEREGHWQWAWRASTDSPDWLSRCLQDLAPGPVFWTGDDAQAGVLQQALREAGLQPQRPGLSQKLQGMADPAAFDEAGSYWVALGLASRRLQS